MEAVEAVHEAVAATPSEEPPLPPYPDISDLSITGKQIVINYIFILMRRVDFDFSSHLFNMQYISAVRKSFYEHWLKYFWRSLFFTK